MTKIINQKFQYIPFIKNIHIYNSILPHNYSELVSVKAAL